MHGGVKWGSEERAGPLPRKLAIIVIANDALELLFTGSALLGAAVLVLVTLAGGARLRPPHLRIQLVERLPLRGARAGDAFLLPMVLGATALFGLGGLFGRAFGLAVVGQLALAVTLGIFGWAFAFAIFATLDRAQSPEPTALRALVGRTATVTVSIDPRLRGTVRLSYDGAFQTLPAVAATRIARGREVQVVAVRGMALAVREMPPP